MIATRTMGNLRPGIRRFLALPLIGLLLSTLAPVDASRVLLRPNLAQHAVRRLVNRLLHREVPRISVRIHPVSPGQELFVDELLQHLGGVSTVQP
ncbi:MAG: hypothetical protein EBY17_27015, partial [Acidobacteriia bacterium]|nr:hypothetical protein [Terriglobia bacterium]